MYCINALTKWCDNWKRKAQRNGEDVWRNSKGKPIVHQQIFERIQCLENQLGVLVLIFMHRI